MMRSVRQFVALALLLSKTIMASPSSTAGQLLCYSCPTPSVGGVSYTEPAPTLPASCYPTTTADPATTTAVDPTCVEPEVVAGYCGLPFTAGASTRLVKCAGMCVTETHYDGSAGVTYIVRGCTDVPLEDGCERRVDGTSSYISWTCIKTCSTDRCNDGSAATSLLPPQLTLLLVVGSLTSLLQRSV